MPQLSSVPQVSTISGARCQCAKIHQPGRYIVYYTGSPGVVRRSVLDESTHTLASSLRITCANALRAFILFVNVWIALGLTIHLSIFITVFSTEGAILSFPFHLPLAVFEFLHWHPGFVTTRIGRRIRGWGIG